MYFGFIWFAFSDYVGSGLVREIYMVRVRQEWGLRRLTFFPLFFFFFNIIIRIIVFLLLLPSLDTYPGW